MNEHLYKSNFKESYGEVNTPFSLVELMISLFPEDFFFNKNNVWLDPGCGQGNISWVLLHKLREQLDTKHILEEMLYLIELNPEREKDVYKNFGDFGRPNLSISNYIHWKPPKPISAIICNPPYNFNGVIKTPTNNNVAKTSDGVNAWCGFINRSLDILKEGGYMCFIVPAIWLKPDDGAGMYQKLFKYKIEKMHCFSASESNKMFNGQAQTPTVLFLLKKEKPVARVFSLFCKLENKYLKFNCENNIPIPMCNTVIINKLLYYCKTAGHLNVSKTNMPPKHTNFSPFKTDIYKYKNIKSVLLCKNKVIDNENKFNTMENTLVGEKVINWSDNPCIGYGIPKIILAHKMYGLPILDLKGEYGISNRDNYIITKYNLFELERIYALLSCPIILSVYDSTRYRMRYLEKYAFHFIPDITKLHTFPNKNINNQTIIKYFNI